MSYIMFMVSNTRFVRVFLGPSFKTLHMICQSSSTIVSKQALATKREKRRRKKKADQDYRNLVSTFYYNAVIVMFGLVLLLYYYSSMEIQKRKIRKTQFYGFLVLSFCTRNAWRNASTNNFPFSAASSSTFQNAENLILCMILCLMIWWWLDWPF